MHKFVYWQKRFKFYLRCKIMLRFKKYQHEDTGSCNFVLLESRVIRIVSKIIKKMLSYPKKL